MLLIKHENLILNKLLTTLFDIQLSQCRVIYIKSQTKFNMITSLFSTQNIFLCVLEINKILSPSVNISHFIL